MNLNHDVGWAAHAMHACSVRMCCGVVRCVAVRGVAAFVVAWAAVVVVAIVAAVAASAAAAAVEPMLPLQRVCVRRGIVHCVVHVCAPCVSLRTAACARLGLLVGARAAGAGQRVQAGLPEPPAGSRGSLGVARRRAWVVRAQRHPTFAVLSPVHSFFW